MDDVPALQFRDALAERAADIAARCTECGKCVQACPMPAPAGIGDADPKAIAGGVIDLLKGGAGTAEAARWVDVCTASGTCITACEDGINPRLMVKLANVALRQRRHGNQLVEQRATNAFRTMTRGVRLLSRMQLPPELLARINPRPSRAAPATPPDVVFYTGCNILKTPHIAVLCLDILERLGVRYEVKGGTSTCCGIFQFREGDQDAAGRVAFNSIDQLKSAGAGEVLSWCPSCQTQFGEVGLPAYERVRGETPFEMTPFLVFLARNLDRLRPLLTQRVNKRVALHERPGVPAAMTAVKQVLTAIPGLDLVELEVPRVGTMANYLNILPALKQELREIEFRAAQAAGVDTLATVYHACHREICHFEPGVSFEIVNFMELLGEAIGISSPDIYKRLKQLQDVDAIIADSGDLIGHYGLDLDELRDALALDMFGGKPQPAAARST